MEIGPPEDQLVSSTSEGVFHATVVYLSWVTEDKRSPCTRNSRAGMQQLEAAIKLRDPNNKVLFTHHPCDVAVSEHSNP